MLWVGAVEAGDGGRLGRGSSLPGAEEHSRSVDTSRCRPRQVPLWREAGNAAAAAERRRSFRQISTVLSQLQRRR